MKLSQITNRKFIESYPGNGRKILTPNGYKEIIEVHKTIPYRKFKVQVENGLFLECSYNHVIIREDYSEVYAKDSLDSLIITQLGISKVIEVIDLEIEEHMYDISIDSEDELYFSQGILSHNSSKSISTSIYLNHLIIFDKEKNIGIVANKGSLAREFLSNVKNIFIELPIWMQIGCKSWNKGFIEFENEMRCLTDVPSQDSFRGFSIHCLDGSSIVHLYDKERKEYFNLCLEDLYNSHYSNYLIKTASGYKNFLGIRRSENTGLIIRTELNEIRCTEEHKILVGKCNSGKIYRKAKNIKINNYINKSKVKNIEIDNNIKYYYDPIEVADCNNYISSNTTHHNCAVIDETAFVRPSIFNEFIDAFLPSQAALSWKKNIVLSTPKGQNHFFDIVKGASPKYAEDGSGIKEKGNSGYTLFKVDWRDVPRYDKNGDLIDPEIFKDTIIKKHGLMYWNQNFACVGGNTYINIYDKYTGKYERTTIEEFKNKITKQQYNFKY